MILETKGLPLIEIERLIGSGVSPGCSIAITTPNSGLESVSFGYLDDPNGEEVNQNTVYDLASITKLFTTALVLRLHESGKLSINDPCGKYLDNFSASGVRLIDLLTHKVDFDIRLSDYRNMNSDRESLVGRLMDIEPPSKASENVHYANLGFIYLGRIIEKLEERDLNRCMNALFEELGLRESYTGADIPKLGIITPATEIVDGRVIRNITHDETSRLLGGIAGNAGVFSTAKDLARFGKAWLQTKVITTNELRQTVFRDHDTSGLKPQAIGWWMRIPAAEGEKNESGLYTHTGFTGSLLAINTQKDKICAFTCNRTYYGRDNNRHKEVWKLLIEWIQK